jgi:hypothetical protein
MPDGLWWENLETNFAQRAEGFELETRDGLRVKATAVGDIALRIAGAEPACSDSSPFPPV